MLYAAAITMTLMGCNDASQDCQFLSQVEKPYQTQIACESAIPGKLQKMINAPYPVITAQCSEEKIEVAQEIAKPIPLTPQIAPTPNTQAQLPNINSTERKRPLRRVLVRIENGFAYVTRGTKNVFENIGERTRNGLKKLTKGLKLRKSETN